MPCGFMPPAPFARAVRAISESRASCGAAIRLAASSVHTDARLRSYTGSRRNSHRVAGMSIRDLPPVCVWKGSARGRQGWRRGRDLNPRYPCEYTRFPSVPNRPLWHLSALAILPPRASIPGEPFRVKPPAMPRGSPAERVRARPAAGPRPGRPARSRGTDCPRPVSGLRPSPEGLSPARCGR